MDVVALPVADEADPNPLAMDEQEEPAAGEKLMKLAGSTGDFSEAISEQDLAKLGMECVADYEMDKQDRKEWEDTVREALLSAAQSPDGKTKDYPWRGASNVKFPILTSAALQFNARMYPAVVKGDEAVLCKVIGQDNGKPVIQPHPVTGQPGPVPQMGPQGPVADEAGDVQPQWLVQPGAKAKRARRVAEYLNTVLFYRMDDWESDTDSLLMQLPIVGCVFRKLWWDTRTNQPRAAMVSALRIFVPEGAKSCDTTPRLTEEIPDVYPHEVSESIRSGHYRNVELFPRNDKGERDKSDDGPRLLLEQHRLMDIDEDGVEEPYIVTVDHKTQKVLRVEANFGPDDVKVNESGEVMCVERGRFYIKYDMFPHPEGKFYGIGLGHLLKQMGAVINTAINQLMDAGHAQTAGGGFIGSGVRLQSRGGGSVVRMQPGEFKTVDVPGDQLRNAIVEKTLPNVSPVTFQVLDLILGAAKDIAGAKDVMTGEASNQGQVGTTLALIEQGLQVFNATAKRTFRSLKDEFSLLKENIRRYGGEAAAREYTEILDDPEADFVKDFDSRDMDIRPVSDPSSVTRMQKLAKGQFLMGTLQQVMAVGGNGHEVMRRVYEAADVEDIDKLLPEPKPQAPDPMQQQAIQAEILGKQTKAFKDHAEGEAATDRPVLEREKLKLSALEAGHRVGMASAA